MVIVAIGLIVTSCGKGVNTNVGLKSDADSALYALGTNYGTGLKEGLKTIPGVGDKVNYDAFLAGLVTAMKDSAKVKMTPEEAETFFQMYVQEASIREANATKEAGEAFLAANKTKEGVITTESGLQYKVLTEGTGRRPMSGERVIAHYTGKLLDGTVFDSSYDHGEPFRADLTFPGILEGWVEGLQIMPVGSKYIFWIPSDLAYGEQGGGLIKANSTLEFEIELLGIQGEE